MTGRRVHVMGSVGKVVVGLLSVGAILITGCTTVIEHAPPGVTGERPTGEGEAGTVSSAGSWPGGAPLGAGARPGAAKLQVEPEALVFGPRTPELQFKVTNAGGGVLHWSLGVEASSPWLTVSHRLGALAPRATTTVTVLVNRSGLPGGDYLDRIFIASNGGYAVVPVWLEVGTAYAGPIQLEVRVERVEGNRVTIEGKVGCTGGIITRLTWLWGDGRLEDHPAPAFPVTHVYPGPGSYPVTVTAYSSTGYQRSKTFQVSVGARAAGAVVARTGRAP